MPGARCPVPPPPWLITRLLPADDDGAAGAASGAGELESELEDEVDEAPFAVSGRPEGAGRAGRGGA